MPPALLPALAVLVGAVAGTFIDSSFPFARPALVVCSAGACFAWWRQSPRFACAIAVAGFGLASATLAAAAREEALYPSLRAVLEKHVGGFLIESLGPENDHEPIRVRMQLVEDAAVREDYVSLRARVLALVRDERRLNAAGGVTLSVSGEAALVDAREWRAGRIIEAPTTFRRPSRYLNDGVADFERQLALDGTMLFGSIKSALLIDIVHKGSALEEWAARVRAHTRSAVARWVAPHNLTAAAIVSAVLIGDRTGLPDEVTDRLQRAGTYHVIAISGGNIAVLAGLVLGLLALSGLNARARAAIAILVLLLYAEVATTGPSVWRATTMAVVYLTARLLDHRTPPWQATTLAAAVMAIVAPLDVRSAGFVLTFGATCALLQGTRLSTPLWTRLSANASSWRRVALWLAASVGASIAVELVLLPVSAQEFSRVTLAGPLLNLAAVPLMAVSQVCGLLVAIFDARPEIARPLGWIASVSAAGIVESARFVDHAPELAWRVPSPGVLPLASYYASLLVVVFAVRVRTRVAAAAVLVVTLLFITGVTSWTPSTAVRGVRLTMLDVGQGEALLLESGSMRLLIDSGGAPFGGGSFDIGGRVVAPALWAHGIRRLDALLVTHGDPDHIGGAPILVDAFRPGALWEGIVVPRHGPSRQLREQARSGRAEINARRQGQSFQWGDARIRVLHPPEPDWERPRVRNDDSVVLEVSCGDVALLLTGDSSGEIERLIAPQLTPARTRVLKVGHHGSRTSSSSTLLESWRPQMALISAGRGNTFGHPAPEVIARLQSIGAEIYRTDRDGQITLESDCRSVFVRTFTDGKD